MNAKKALIWWYCIAAALGELISVANQRLVDSDGRERIFHGVNVVSKSILHFR